MVIWTETEKKDIVILVKLSDEFGGYDYKAYIYKNSDGVSDPSLPLGTGVNFTYY